MISCLALPQYYQLNPLLEKWLSRFADQIQPFLFDEAGDHPK